MVKRPPAALAKEFVNVVLRVVRDEISAKSTKFVYGQVGEITSTGISVAIEGNFFNVQWKASGLTLATGDVVILMSSPSMPLTILCKRVKTY